MHKEFMEDEDFDYDNDDDAEDHADFDEEGTDICPDCGEDEEECECDIEDFKELYGYEDDMEDDDESL